MIAQRADSLPMRGAVGPAAGHRSRRAYVVLAWVLAAGVALQVLLAGLAVFDDPTRWAAHVRFGQLLEAVPLVMIALAVAGWLPVRLRWLTVALFGLYVLQHAFINLARGLDLPVIAAFHPVNALAIFSLAVLLARRAASSAPVRRQ